MSSLHSTHQPFAESGTRALFVAAHPDDEFLTAGALEALRKNNVTVRALIASDREASSRGERNFVRSGGRREEGALALAAYGIPRDRQYFLNLPDGRLREQEFSSAVTRTIGDMLYEHGITTVVTLGRLGVDSHPDHVATHTAAYEAIAGHVGPDLGTVRLFGLDTSNPTTHIAADPTLKFRNLAYHESQFGIDVSNPSYTPKSGTVEVKEVQLTDRTRADLDPYDLLLTTEPYRLELPSLNLMTGPNNRELARV